MRQVEDVRMFGCSMRDSCCGQRASEVKKVSQRESVSLRALVVANARLDE